MPTKIYTNKPISSVSHGGKSFAVKDGAVDVPDDAVATLCESHGFTEKPVEIDDEDDLVFDPKTLSREALIELGNKDFNLGLTMRSSKADALAAVQAAIAKADKK